MHVTVALNPKLSPENWSGRELILLEKKFLWLTKMWEIFVRVLIS